MPEHDHYIKLISKNSIDHADLRTFYDILKDKAGPTIKITNEGKPITHFMNNGDHVYCVYLFRNLTESEKENIIDDCIAKLSIPGIKLRISQDKKEEIKKRLPELFKPTIEKEVKKEIIPEIEWDIISLELAKYNHNLWMNSKLAHGWRWGVSFDLENKTHPLLVSWENLPEEYRHLDPNFKEFFANLLSSLGVLSSTK